MNTATPVRILGLAFVMVWIGINLLVPPPPGLIPYSLLVVPVVFHLGAAILGKGQRNHGTTPWYFLKYQLFIGPYFGFKLMVAYVAIWLWFDLLLSPTNSPTFHEDPFFQIIADFIQIVVPVVIPLVIIGILYLLLVNLKNDPPGCIASLLAWPCTDALVLSVLYITITHPNIQPIIPIELPSNFWPLLFIIYITSANLIYRRNLPPKPYPA